MARIGEILRAVTDTVHDPFTSDISGLDAAAPTDAVELADGARFDLVAGAVRTRLGDRAVRMLACNGSSPSACMVER